MPNARHAPARVRPYFDTHDGCMEAFRKRGFVSQDSLVTEWLSGYMRMRGEIACLGEIVISVEKLMQVMQGTAGSPDATIQTVYYAYNASVRGGRNIARVDNADHHNHPDRHHRHDFDPQTGAEKLSWIGEDAWPTLGEFIDEIERWYWEHRGELQNADFYPVLLR